MAWTLESVILHPDVALRALLGEERRREGPELRVGGHVIQLDGELTVTTIPSGTIVATPEPTQEYADRAADLGYGSDVALMSREHEIAHALLARALRLPESPTLAAVATHGPHWSGWRDEESAVLSIQRMARRLSVDLEETARWWFR